MNNPCSAPGLRSSPLWASSWWRACCLCRAGGQAGRHAGGQAGGQAGTQLPTCELQHLQPRRQRRLPGLALSARRAHGVQHHRQHLREPQRQRRGTRAWAAASAACASSGQRHGLRARQPAWSLTLGPQLAGPCPLPLPPGPWPRTLRPRRSRMTRSATEEPTELPEQRSCCREHAHASRAACRAGGSGAGSYKARPARPAAARLLACQRPGC